MFRAMRRSNFLSCPENRRPVPPVHGGGVADERYSPEAQNFINIIPDDPEGMTVFGYDDNEEN
jgi:hypothetical protein